MYSTTGKAKMSNGNIKKENKKIRVSPKKEAHGFWYGVKSLMHCRKKRLHSVYEMQSFLCTFQYGTILKYRLI